jgi:PAS domain S-box-containing protein
MTGLKAKLVKSHLLIAVFGAVLLMISLATIVLLRIDLDKLNTHSMPMVQVTEKIQTNLQMSLAALRGWMNLGDTNYKKERKEAWQKGITPNLRKLKELDKKTKNITRKKDLDELTKMLNTLEMWQWRIEDVANTDGNYPSQLFLKRQLYPAADQIISLTDVLVNSYRYKTEVKIEDIFHLLYFKSHFVQQLYQITNYVATGSKISLSKAKELINQSKNDLKKIKAEITDLNQENKKLLKALILQFDYYSSLFSNLISYRSDKGYSISDRMLAEKAAPIANKLSSLLEKMITAEDLNRDEVVDKASALVKAIILIVILFAIIIIVFTFWLGNRNAKKMLAPIYLLRDATRKMASGEMNENLAITTRDEIGDLTKSFNEMLHSRKIADEKMLQTVESAVDAIITINEKGIIQSCNSATTVLLGYVRTELLQNNISMLMPEPYHSEHDGYLQRYLETNTKNIIGKSRDVMAESKSGEKIPVRLSISEIKVGSERLFVGIIHDIRDEIEYANRMNKLNEKLAKENDEKELVSEIERRLRSADTVESFSKILLKFMAEHFNCLLSLFYLVDSKKKSIKLIHGYGFKEKRNRTTVIKWGEGLVGQCVLSKEFISIDNPQEDYFKISSGLGEKTPQHIIIKPLLYKEEVIGVVELSSLDIIDEESIKLINKIILNLIIILNSVISRCDLVKLLEKTEKQKQYLQQQEEELRSTNEELESQSNQIKLSEEEMRSMNEELQAKMDLTEKQKEELNEQSIEIKKSSQYKSEFISNMSHELRTPLNSLLILAERFTKNKSQNLTEDQIEEAGIIYQSGNDLLILINDILDISKVEAGKLLIEYVNIDLSDLLLSIERQFKHMAENKGIKFNIDTIGLTNKSVSSDSLRLTQILKNLLSNALKFTEKGSVTLTVKQEGKNIVFEVSDTGIGIPQEMREKVFSAFQQADGSTSRKYGGTGLGLSISKKLAELMNGNLSLDPKNEQGSTFILTLPLLESGDAVSEINEQTIAPEESQLYVRESTDEIPQSLPDDRNKLDNQKATILIIDDDESFIKVLSKSMQEEEFNVLKAMTANAGIQLAILYQPDGIILDLGLPDRDGKEVLEILKKDTRTLKIPIHIISAEDKSSELIKKGAVSFLQKPIRERQITDLISMLNLANRNRILIVDDDVVTQKIVKETFASFSASLELETVDNAKDAKLRLASSNYMCVIVDLGLPDMSGISLIRSMVEEMKILIPIVVYTARELTPEEYKKIKKYTDKVIVKGPESTERLVDEVQLFAHHIQEKSNKAPEKKLKVDKPQFLNERVLLVDDDIRNTFSLSRSLEEEGLDVIIADNGKLAIEKIMEDETITLVLMDMMMPIMDGYEAIKKIREIPKYKSLPIISLTARATNEDRKECLSIGANDFMSKPIKIDSLLELIRFWISNAGAYHE